jgi:hypothetical protein
MRDAWLGTLAATKGDLLKRDRQGIRRALLKPCPSCQIHGRPLGSAGSPGALEAIQGGTFSGVQFRHKTYLDIGVGVG